MSEQPTPHEAAILATAKLVEPLPQAVPCDRATAAEIAHDLGYECNEHWIEGAQEWGFLPQVDEWNYSELTILFAALDFRERWRAGFFDRRKSQARLSLERQDLSLVNGELLAVMKYDLEWLLSAVKNGHRSMSDIEMHTVVECIRWRLGILKTKEQPA